MQSIAVSGNRMARNGSQTKLRESGFKKSDKNSAKEEGKSSNSFISAFNKVDLNYVGGDGSIEDTLSVMEPHEFDDKS